jgi:hypothetical protein
MDALDLFQAQLTHLGLEGWEAVSANHVMHEPEKNIGRLRHPRSCGLDSTLETAYRGCLNRNRAGWQSEAIDNLEVLQHVNHLT